MKKIIMLLSLLVGLLLLSGCVQQMGKDARTISTSGSVTTTVQPDEAILQLTIETSAPTAEASKNKNSEITDKMYAALYKISVPRGSIETSYFNIYEDYDYTQLVGRRSLGFKTQHALKITSKDIASVGKIIDAVTGAGATRIDSISFDLSEDKKDEIRSVGLEKAAQDARLKAEAMARGIKARLGDVVSISDSTYDYSPYSYYDKGMMTSALEEARTTEISPHSLDVTTSVQVSFEIK